MAGMASVSIIGNVGRDPESKAAGSTTVCRFSVAVNERVKGQDETVWFNVVAFGKTGELAQEYLTKGKQVFVEGRLQVRKYEKDGQERQAIEVIASKIVFLGGRSEEDGAARANRGSRASKPTMNDVDDIPF